MVSQKHANFLINTGDATAADIEGLGEEVRRRVYEMTGVMLEWEIHRIGLPTPYFDIEDRDRGAITSAAAERCAVRTLLDSRSPCQGPGEDHHRLITR